MNDKHAGALKSKGWLHSLNCAIEGVIFAFKHERHIKVHYVIAAAALLLSLFLNLSMVEFALFAVSVVILLFAEMMNTAMEQAVNLIEDRHHIIAKNAKDISAGAVLISSIAVGITAYMIFSKHIHAPFEEALKGAAVYAGHAGVIALLLVLIAVVALKAATGKGAPLHGGMPSGHSAVAFSLFTSISLMTMNPVVVIFSFVLAIMVSHSRLVAGIHTRFEVFIGALLGIGLTLLAYKFYLLTLK